MTTETTTNNRQAELDIFAAFTTTGPAPKVSPAELKAETLYSKVRQGRISYESAMNRMPTTAAARQWRTRLIREFGPDSGLNF